MGEPWGKTGVASRLCTTWALFAGSGCLLLFLAPPIGFILLLFSAGMQMFIKKIVPGICPHCRKDTSTIRQAGISEEFLCVHCGKPIVLGGSREKPVFEKAPNPFADAGANETAWNPIGASANFRTEELVQAGPGRMEFRGTGAMKRFFLFVVAAGVGVMVLVIATKGLSFEGDVVWPLLIGLLFATVGGYGVLRGSIPLVFDKTSGLFWKGRRPPNPSLGEGRPGTFGRLDDILALQLLSGTSSGRRSYFYYELNLVLREGARIHVTAHADTSRLHDDAYTLATFLGKPIWDKT
jgi:hypothetical protein